MTSKEILGLCDNLTEFAKKLDKDAENMPLEKGDKDLINKFTMQLMLMSLGFICIASIVSKAEDKQNKEDA